MWNDAVPTFWRKFRQVSWYFRHRGVGSHSLLSFSCLSLFHPDFSCKTYLYQTRRCHTPDDGHSRKHRRENLQPRMPSATGSVSECLELSTFRTHLAYFSHDRNDCGEVVVGLGWQRASLNLHQSVKGEKQITGQRILLCDIWRCRGLDFEAQVSGL